MATIKKRDGDRKQLLEEIESLRRRIDELEGREHTYKQVDELLTILRMNSPVGFFVIQDKKFVFTSKEFLTILGYKNEELLGIHSLDVVHPRDRMLVREKAIEMLKGEIESPYQYRIIGKDGKVRWVLEGVVSVQFKGERAALGHIMNITDRLQAEAKMRKLLENEKKLRRKLEAEVKKRVEYTRMLVHELKTPLTPVLFSSELLAGELHDEQLAKVARNIHRGATNLNNRINELLDIARGEVGLLKIKPKKMNVHQLLTNVANYIQPLMDRNRQAFIYDITEAPLYAWADEERLQQVILNLLVNASKFSPEESKIILKGKKDSDSLIVQIEDNGPGVSEEYQKKIFKPYQRYDTGNRECMSGLGLGLSLCKSIVELHGGKIWLQSEKGEGTVFTFTVPLKNRAKSDHA